LLILFSCLNILEILILNQARSIPLSHLSLSSYTTCFGTCVPPYGLILLNNLFLVIVVISLFYFFCIIAITSTTTFTTTTAFTVTIIITFAATATTTAAIITAIFFAASWTLFLFLTSYEFYTQKSKNLLLYFFLWMFLTITVIFLPLSSGDKHLLQILRLISSCLGEYFQKLFPTWDLKTFWIRFCFVFLLWCNCSIFFLFFFWFSRWNQYLVLTFLIYFFLWIILFILPSFLIWRRLWICFEIQDIVIDATRDITHLFKKKRGFHCCSPKTPNEWINVSYYHNLQLIVLIEVHLILLLRFRRLTLDRIASSSSNLCCFITSIL